MNRKMLIEIVSILKESSIYGTLSAGEKRSLITGLAERCSFLEDATGAEFVGYKSSSAEIVKNMSEKTH